MYKQILWVCIYKVCIKVYKVIDRQCAFTKTKWLNVLMEVICVVYTVMQATQTHSMGKMQRLFFNIKPLKTKRVCVTQGISPYSAINPLHLGYKNQTLNVVKGKIRSLF
jgi:hypothetical protein